MKCWRVKKCVPALLGSCSLLLCVGVFPPSKTPTPNMCSSLSSSAPLRAHPPQFVTFLTTTDPTTLGEYALGLVAFYYLGPPALGAAFGALRGFAGEAFWLAAGGPAIPWADLRDFVEIAIEIGLPSA